MTPRWTLALRAAFALALLPPATGFLIVTYQDALLTHLPAKVATAALLRAGDIPFVNPCQSFGQPLAGNPNFGTFFPDTLLFLVLPANAAFGFRFALALVLAFIGARRWARAEGIPRPAAEAAGYAFALSGVFLSTWRFYNSGLALALAPFVLAAVAKICRREGRLRRLVAELALWSALEVLAGEPVVAMLIAVAAVVRLAAHAVGDDGDAPRPVRVAGAIAGSALLAGLIAAPQIVATMQSYPGSTRDVAPFSFAMATGTSVHPARALEQVIPFPHGRPDLTGPLGFHGHALHDNHSPYLWTLHLGWAVVLLLVRHGRPLARGERAWWLAAAIAAVLSLGYRLPAAKLLFEVLSLGGRVRLPVKWWYFVALCLVVPIARAAARPLEGEPWTRPRALLAGLLGLGALASLVAIDLRTPWSLATLAVSALAAAVVALPTVRPGPLVAAVALSLAFAHLPLALAFVDRPPAGPPRALAPARVYERVEVDAHPPGGGEPGHTRDVFRRGPRELWATAGCVGGYTYAFDRDPDGSYADADREARKAIDALPWPERADALRAQGVRYVVVSEPIPALREAWRDGGSIVYDLGGEPADVDLSRTVEIAADGVVVWPRTFFPAWRATVDGRPVAPVPSDGHLLGVPVPAGRHEVRVWWSKTPLLAGLAAALIGLAVAATMGFGGRE